MTTVNTPALPLQASSTRPEAPALTTVTVIVLSVVWAVTSEPLLLVLRAGGGLTLRLLVGLFGLTLKRLCRPSPPEDLRRDLIGAWHSPQVRAVRRRSASSVVKPNEGTVQMIVISADTHKGTHALAAVDEGTGRVCDQREIKAEESGHLAALRWARGLGEERVWAIEDCRHVSRRLEQALQAAGERVVRVAAASDGRFSARGRAGARQV